MKYTEVEFKKEVESLYNGEIEVIGKYKGLTKSILIKDKYGLLEIRTARQLLVNRPSISKALNKNEYLMNQIKEVSTDIFDFLTPKSEYKTAKSKMLFETEYGLISVTPDSLLAGHKPNIRSAVNRKEYFKNQLLKLYDNNYDFIINSTDRHKGRCILICKEHGEVSIDNDHVFSGQGCPKCNTNHYEKSTLFYLIRLVSDDESFYKLGISHKDINGNVKRFRNYRSLGYEIEVIKTVEFDDFLKCKEFESKLKKIIRPLLYKPLKWDYDTSTECFSESTLPIILSELNMI